MGFRINYEAIRSRIRDVSYIDTENVKFVKRTRGNCPDCFVCPITGQSSNPMCRTCGGNGTIDTSEESVLIASVDRVRGTETHYEYGGTLPKGSVILTVHESQIVGAGFSLDTNWVTEVDWFEVGGVRYKLQDGDSVIPQTLQGEIYEIIFHLSRIVAGGGS